MSKEGTNDVRKLMSLFGLLLRKSKYRIGVRRMTFESGTKQIMYNGKVEDGQSVRSTYIMVKDLKVIRGVYESIDI